VLKASKRLFEFFRLDWPPSVGFSDDKRREELFRKVAGGIDENQTADIE